MSDARPTLPEHLSTHQRRELGEQVERVAQVLEGRPLLTIGVVEAGRHL